MTPPHSEWQKSWRRFRRNLPAMGGLGFLFFAIFCAVFGYSVAPDGSTDANIQLPEMALQGPGARVQVLALPLNTIAAPVSLWKRLWSGQPVARRLIPIKEGAWRVEGDSLFYQRLNGKSTWEHIHLMELVAPVTGALRSDRRAYALESNPGQLFARAAILEAWQRGEFLQERRFPLGADKYGRCILSRLLLGFRISLSVGLIAVVISLSIGLLVGLLGGYFGGRLDDWLMLLINTIWSIPTLLLVFAIVLALGRGAGVIFTAVGLSMWVDVARMVRGQTMVLRNLPFVEAARSMGLGHSRILYRHILPNLLGPVMVVAAGNFATAVLLESGLSYLGFGVQPPAPSWGSMLNEHYGYAISGQLLPALAPATAIALTVLAFNLIGNGLRDALDVKAN